MVAYYNEMTDSLEQAIRLKGFGNIEFNAQGNPKTTYNVVHDGCSVSESEIVLGGKLQNFTACNCQFKKNQIMIVLAVLRRSV